MPSVALRFVPRDSLRGKLRQLRFNHYGLETATALALPAPPQSFDWSNGRKIKFPLDGNDRYGDCFFTTMCHASNAMTGIVTGVADFFDPAQIIPAYLKLSGGDNGLNTDQVMPYWQNGILGSAHKIWDFMQVSATNPAAQLLAGWQNGGLVFTAALPDAWVANPRPGMVWDNGPGVQANPRNGHAMYISGRNPDGTLNVETWGFDEPIKLTPAGLALCDPELFCVASNDWFDANGRSPTGINYNDFAIVWRQEGGGILPSSAFPPAPSPLPPTPTPTPKPVPFPPLPPGAISVIQSTIDALFSQLQDSLAGHPFLKVAVATLQKRVDAYIQSLANPRMSGTENAQLKLENAQIKAIIDVVLGLVLDAFASNVQVVAIVSVLKNVLDSYLSQ